MTTRGPLEFVFSFRSPFAWVAVHRVLPMVHPDTEIRWTPFYPLPSFPNFGRMTRQRVLYNIEDIQRLAKEYGLQTGSPPIGDPDWSIPHAAFVHADAGGKGPAFGARLLHDRWCHGKDIVSEAVIGEAAEAVGLDPDAAIAASADAGLRADLTARIAEDYEKRGLFGVPMFVLPDGSRFWGHDRMEWAIRHGYVVGA